MTDATVLRIPYSFEAWQNAERAMLADCARQMVALPAKEQWDKRCELNLTVVIPWLQANPRPARPVPVAAGRSFVADPAWAANGYRSACE